VLVRWHRDENRFSYTLVQRPDPNLQPVMTPAELHPSNFLYVEPEVPVLAEDQSDVPPPGRFRHGLWHRIVSYIFGGP
jgi:hypothetical protein